jgi:diaminopimelate decarboxylase
MAMRGSRSGPRPPRSLRLAAMPSTATRIDDCLSIRDGRLWTEECDAVDLARRFGTPVYAVSEDQLRRNARRIAAAFAANWPEGDVALLPSLKANLSLALRRILNSEGLGCDTFGPGELHAALASGIDPALISVNGSVKDAPLVTRAVEAGARLTLDSPAELDLVAAAARTTGRTARIRLRLRPDYDGLDVPSDFDPSVTVRAGAHRYKPGIPLEQAAAVARRALATPGVELTGLMAHLGRHRADPEVWGAMAASFAAAVGRVCAELDGWRPGEIDVGGGFPAPRDPTGHAPAPPIEDIAAALTSNLRDGLRAAGIDPAGILLEAEPGRALYADTGIHLATVRHLKEQTAPIPMRWVETDTTEMFMADLLIEHARFQAVAASRGDAPPVQTADLVGMSCGFDVLVPDARLPSLEPGDVIAFLDTGAYQDACASNFNGLPRPGTVLVSGSTAEWIKRPETVEDVFGRDVVPERLA